MKSKSKREPTLYTCHEKGDHEGHYVYYRGKRGQDDKAHCWCDTCRKLISVSPETLRKAKE